MTLFHRLPVLTNHLCCRSDVSLGRPGIPGSNDLETALKRLSMRKANEINERIINEHHERRQR